MAAIGWVDVGEVGGFAIPGGDSIAKMGWILARFFDGGSFLREKDPVGVADVVECRCSCLSGDWRGCHPKGRRYDCRISSILSLAAWMV